MKLSLRLVGLGGIFAFFELTRAPLSRKSHSDDPENKAVYSDKPEAERASSSWESWIALLILGLLVFIIFLFLMWLPGPI